MTNLEDVEARIAALEARIQELEDDRGIRDTLSRYGFTADGCKDEDFVDLYTEDGAIRIARGKRGGADFAGEGWTEWTDKEGIRTFITHPQGHHSPRLYGKSMHLQGNNLVTDIDGDEAVARSYQVAIAADENGVQVLSAGNNTWQMRKVDGKWLIKERRGAYLGDNMFTSNVDE